MHVRPILCTWTSESGLRAPARGHFLTFQKCYFSNFQGNLICKITGRVFKLHGLRTDETLDSIPEISDEIAASPSRLLELRSNLSTGGRSTPSESSDGSSCDREVDPEVGLALLDLVLDDTEEAEINANGGEKLLSYFSICVNDMDTGVYLF